MFRDGDIYVEIPFVRILKMGHILLLHMVCQIILEFWDPLYLSKRKKPNVMRGPDPQYLRLKTLRCTLHC